MPKKRVDEWPDSRVDSLRQLAKDGYSAREIVDRLWLEGFKTTRNAVLGVAHRRNIDVGIVSGAGYLQSVRYGRKGKMTQADLPPRSPLLDTVLCQWPMGEFWCGCVAEEGPYCKAHHALAYTGKLALSEHEINFYTKGALNEKDNRSHGNVTGLVVRSMRESICD